MVASCSINELGKVTGGKVGDQTGNEYYVRQWYNGNWDCVLRYPVTIVATEIADLARKIAYDNKVGYSQTNRLELYKSLKDVNWDYDKIKSNCDADCSSSTSAILIAVGYKMGNSLKMVNPSSTTRNLKVQLMNMGFELYDTREYLTSAKYLKEGDILLREGHHVVVNLTNGEMSDIKKDEIKLNTEYEVGKFYYTAVSWLAIRKGAGTQYSYVGESLPKMTKVQVLEIKKVGNATWLRISSGWICGKTSKGVYHVR
jgi:hypothetical protein